MAVQSDSQHSRFEAEIDHLKAQQAATWQRIEDNQKELKTEMGRIASVVQAREVKAARTDTAFDAIQADVGRLATRTEAGFKAIQAQLDGIGTERKIEKNVKLEWAYLGLMVIAILAFSTLGIVAIKVFGGGA